MTRKSTSSSQVADAREPKREGGSRPAAVVERPVAARLGRRGSRALSLSALDLVVLLALGLGYLHGRKRGFAELSADLVTMAGGGLLATALSAPLAPYFGSTQPANRLLAWLATYAAVALALSLV